MAEDAARTEHRPRLGRGLAALLGRRAGGARRGRRWRAAPARRRSNSCARIRATRASGSMTSSSRSWPASIRERGVIQPMLVRAIPRVADAYEIIAGERRWRAAQRAGLHEIPIIVIEAGDREALEIAIIENVQRTDLNALEEAAGYAQLGGDHGYSHADIARIVGKSRSHVANTLRLINLPEHTKGLLAAGQISAGHARALLAVADPDAVADRIVAEGLTVRDVERLGENAGAVTRARTKAPRAIDAGYAGARGEAQPRARGEGDDPACWRERGPSHQPSAISSSSTTSAAASASRPPGDAVFG